MPCAVGTVSCDDVPTSVATIHAIRTAWLACTDWQEFANYYCPAGTNRVATVAPGGTFADQLGTFGNDPGTFGEK
jgi:hypothetical protein